MGFCLHVTGLLPVATGKLELASGHWLLASGKLELASGHWLLASGQKLIQRQEGRSQEQEASDQQPEASYGA